MCVCECTGYLCVRTHTHTYNVLQEYFSLWLFLFLQPFRREPDSLHVGAITAALIVENLGGKNSDY